MQSGLNIWQIGTLTITNGIGSFVINAGQIPNAGTTTIEFVNMTVDQLETFEDLLTTLEDADEEVEDFSFAYFLEQYEDEDEDEMEEE